MQFYYTWLIAILCFMTMGSDQRLKSTIVICDREFQFDDQLFRVSRHVWQLVFNFVSKCYIEGKGKHVVLRRLKSLTCFAQQSVKRFWVLQTIIDRNNGIQKWLLGVLIWYLKKYIYRHHLVPDFRYPVVNSPNWSYQWAQVERSRPKPNQTANAALDDEYCRWIARVDFVQRI